MQSILVIEDEERIASLIRRVLEENGFMVTVAESGIRGREYILSNHFDLVVSDIILPGINGVELCREIKKIKPHLPVIMLTALGTTDDKVEGLDAGSDDYLVKPFEIKEFIARINSLLRRYQLLTATDHTRISTLTYDSVEINLDIKTVRREGKEIKLTPKEFNLLEYLMRNPERVLSRAEIAANVWDTHFDTGTNFIDVYINYLRNKIDKNFETKLIHTRTGMGFILNRDEN